MKKIMTLSLAILGATGLLLAVSTSAAQAACVKNVAYGDKLNMRTGPGVGYGKKGAIPRQSCGVRVFWGRRVGSWLPVRYAGMRGWVNARFIGGRGGMGRRCKANIKVFKSGGVGSAYAPRWKKRQIKRQARVKWQNEARYRYGLPYAKWVKARRKMLTCSIDYRSPSYVCRAEAKPCRY